ncbi:hypothetical protein BKA67DRAFT_519734 [Truncatella angustata]|uniref:Uncharacterized protein n=1 Tax=Truncatella angustata TaxID=152316 RepID=A0A9P8UJP4_9PEZI|nr:uncharacterized protein BKA67DRAFT_519734 [Truncatella angustata]KAH6653485.1 hypothetical protein BKA67DRAFT_519734 [Truncatella angustata]
MADSLKSLAGVATLPPRRRRNLYIKMLIENDQSVDWYYAISPKVLNWTLLAGYIVLPSTFTTMNRSEAFNTMMEDNELVLKAFQNPPLLGLALFLFIVSLIGLTCIWWVWKCNYIWSLNNIITQVHHTPLLTNSLLGFSTTLLNVYAVRDGTWSAIAIASITATSFCLLISILAYTIYSIWLLKPIRAARAGRNVEGYSTADTATHRKE